MGTFTEQNVQCEGRPGKQPSSSRRVGPRAGAPHQRQLPGQRDQTGRVAMLIDLENIVRVGGGRLLPAQQAGTVLERALDLAGPADFRLAIAPTGVLQRLAGALRTLRLPCEAVRAGPDAADAALLAHAEHLVSIGYTSFIVISADHYFSEICRRYPTTVIARHGQPVARVLRQTAVAVLAA